MTDSLKERLRADLNSARRERDKLRTAVLTTTISEIRNREIEVGHELRDEEVVEVLSRAVKQRREAAEQMRGPRPELADKEEREAELLTDYLPPALEEPEVREMMRAAIAGGADNIGALMGRVMPALKGRFDGKEANRIAREELG